MLYEDYCSCLKTRLIAFYGVTTVILDYGSFLYDCSANTHLSKLDKLQNQALQIIGGYIKSSPIHVIESDVSHLYF